jgi:glycosyltransferase involved in cell wall biosynthesis
MNSFVILIPSYNVEKWVQKNITSVLEQDYDNYKVFYIDDCSKDDTGLIVEQKLQRKLDKEHYKFIKNSFNKGKMENVFEAIRDDFILEDDIVVILDGDDWLFDKSVLQKLNSIYSNGEDVWMTAGSYMESVSKAIVTPQINSSYWQGEIRKKSWQASHLVSFRKKLFTKIKRKHFMKKTGEFFSTTSDQAMVWPMLEMSGERNFRVVKDVLYVYNRENPLSDDRAFRIDQLQTEAYVRNIEPYKKLDKL